MIRPHRPPVQQQIIALISPSPIIACSSGERDVGQPRLSTALRFGRLADQFTGGGRLAERRIAEQGDFTIRMQNLFQKGGHARRRLAALLRQGMIELVNRVANIEHRIQRLCVVHRRSFEVLAVLENLFRQLSSKRFSCDSQPVICISAFNTTCRKHQGVCVFQEMISTQVAFEM